ncbi:MAG: hypothetical protein N2255_00200, partial [Kiritimatiellae bacterium]|nr:hypothetical protein [Kiritimatiellia bacterium]
MPIFSSETASGDADSRHSLVTRTATSIPNGAADLRVQATPVRDRYADASVVASRSETISHEGLIKRVRIVRTEGSFPLIRVEDTLRKDVITGRHVLVSQIAMVADHIMVKLRTEASEAELETINEKLGGTIRRKMRTPG